jgi:hypothetical protein
VSSPLKHPIRDVEIQADIERWTLEHLRNHRGTGRISIEFDFNNWTAVSIRPLMEGPRKRLTRREDEGVG